jgi:hypothetical protein
MDTTLLAETEAFIARQREALLNQRQELLNQQQAIQQQLDQLDEMLAKFDVFEGKSQPGKQNRSAGSRRSSTRRGSRREELLRIIREGGGLTRGEILERMGLKGNKTGEMSVSNALTALAKNNNVQLGEGRKYVAARGKAGPLITNTSNISAWQNSIRRSSPPAMIIVPHSEALPSSATDRRAAGACPRRIDVLPRWNDCARTRVRSGRRMRRRTKHPPQTVNHLRLPVNYALGCICPIPRLSMRRLRR